MTFVALPSESAAVKVADSPARMLVAPLTAMLLDRGAAGADTEEVSTGAKFAEHPASIADKAEASAKSDHARDLPAIETFSVSLELHGPGSHLLKTIFRNQVYSPTKIFFLTCHVLVRLQANARRTH
jgi:hypothetical protein